jgi:hypothetical protein
VKQISLNEYLHSLSLKWKNQSRIYGEAVEQWISDHFRCPKCDNPLEKCGTNMKSVDHICSGCGEKYQVKASAKSHQKKDGSFSITGAAYDATLSSIGSWNILLVEYNNTKDIEDLIAELPDNISGIEIDKENKERCQNQYIQRYGTQADQKCVGYVKKISLISRENISEDNVIPRKPLGPTARRAGWQGCYLNFGPKSVTEILGVNNEFKVL